jgi:adenylyl cyclase-associated protein
MSDIDKRDAEQVEWVKAYFQIFRDLIDYCKTYFPNGIPWNSKGLPAAEAAKSVAGAPSPAAAPAPAPAPTAGGPPPPPPPGPPPVLKINNEQKAQPSPAGGLGAVFSELNKGEDVTKGLRKVDRSEMTHKNPSLRAGSTVPDGGASSRGKSPAPGKKPKPESMRVKKPPKKELDGNKWTIVCLSLSLPFLAPFINPLPRKTLTNPPSQSSSKSPCPTRSSFPSATTLPSSSRAKPTP